MRRQTGLRGLLQVHLPQSDRLERISGEACRGITAINGLDGIHFDYIRFPDVIIAESLQPKYGIVQDREYPEYDYCYCDVCRSQCEERYGFDAIDRLREHGKPTQLFSGLFVSAVAPSGLTKLIEKAYEGGAKGVVLFSYRQMNDRLWKAFVDAVKA